MPLRHAIFKRECGLTFRAPLTNISNLILGQLGAAVALTVAFLAALADRSAVCATSFGDLVLCVFRRGAKKQMIGPGASTIVTGMADTQSIRDRSICQFPRHAVGEFDRSLRMALMDAAITCTEAVAS